MLGKPQYVIGIIPKYHLKGNRSLSLSHPPPLVQCLIIYFIFVFTSQQKGRKDAVNFDAEFTKEDPVLTFINAEVVRAINQAEFVGFSFVNKAFKTPVAAPCQA